LKNYALAIDGPAGAGKSSVAKMLANRLGFTYIDTGAMYRATTYKALKLKIDLTNADQFAFLNETKMEFIAGVLFLDGIDVTQKIRTNQVSNNVSVVASHIPVRNKLVEIQQAIAQNTNVVMDGRDIGTVVLPHADLKIYMTASVEERARRRHEENLGIGVESDYEKLIKEIERRDRIDSSRAYNPLKQAEDAIYLDTSDLDIKAVTDKIFQLFTDIINRKGGDHGTNG
jgi:CMP/dCMP kinase